jgi:hypothetical protein
VAFHALIGLTKSASKELASRRLLRPLRLGFPRLPAADCEWVGTGTTCSASCGTLVSTEGATELAGWLANISQHVCGDYEAAGCGPLIIPPCVPPPPFDCVQGVSTSTF